MRVLVLAPTLKSLGGIQRYVATLATALGDFAGKENVRVVSLDLADGKRSWAARAAAAKEKLRFAVTALCQGVAWRPDLVICAHVGIAPLGKLLRALGGAPYWVMAYGIEVWGELRPRDQDALTKADCVVVISEFTREQVMQLQGVRAAQTGLLPPCLDSEWMAEALSYPAEPKREGQSVLLTVSRLSSAERYKGHDVVLRALPRVREKIPNAVYVVVGDGDDRSRLEELSRSLGLTEAVRFEGAVSGEALQNWYRDCDVFVMPARTVLDKSAPKGEGFGIVFLEAMAYGKPVMGPESGAPSEFIHDGQHGILVDPQDAAEVAEALIEILSSPERARKMGLEARNWVAQEYSYARFGKRLRKLFEEHHPERSSQQ